MIVKYEELGSILKFIGISQDLIESVAEYGEWTFGDTDIVLVKSPAVKQTIISFIQSGIIEEIDDSNEISFSEEKLIQLTKNYFDTIPSDYYIDISR